MGAFTAKNSDFEQPLAIDLFRIFIILVFLFIAVVLVAWFRAALTRAMARGKLTTTVTTLLCLLISSLAWSLNELVDIISSTSAVYIPTTAKLAAEGTIVTVAFTFFILGLLNVLLFFHEAFHSGSSQQRIVNL